MTVSASTPASAPVPPISGISDGRYQPGVCNIGPAEIARRRRAGHVGVLITIALLVVLVVLNVPPLARLIVALPAAAAASGWLKLNKPHEANPAQNLNAAWR